MCYCLFVLEKLKKQIKREVLIMLPISELPYLELPDIVDRCVREIVEIFRLAQKNIAIFSGIGHWLIFSHPYIKKIIREKHAEGVSISISLGPILSVWPDGPELDRKSSGILELVREGVVNLFRRERGGSHFHFIAIDNERVWIKNPHKPHAPFESFYEQRFKEAKKDSPEFTKALRTCRGFSRGKIRVKNPWKEFLLLFPSQIDFICKSSPRFNMLTRDEIEKILENYQ